LEQWKRGVIGVNLVANEQEHMGPQLLTLTVVLDEPAS